MTGIASDLTRWRSFRPDAGVVGRWLRGGWFRGGMSVANESRNIVAAGLLVLAIPGMAAERLPNTGPGLAGRFHPTYASVHEPSNSVARAVPECLRPAVMYQLFTRMFTPEGTFAAAQAKLRDLRELGVSVIYLTPHQLADDDPDPRHWSARQKAFRLGNPQSPLRQKDGGLGNSLSPLRQKAFRFGNSKNPYRQKDFFAVDPEYGSAADLKTFVAAAHALGMRVMFDLVYFHCGPTAVFLKEHPDYIVRNPDGSPRLGEWAFPEMNLANPAVREYLYANMTGFVRDYGVDGFRCDVADMLPVDFWEEGYRRCRRLRPDIFMMCEGLRGDDQIAAFDLSYGFYTQWTMVEMLKGKADATMLEKAWLAQQRDYPSGFHWMRCFENHDFANCKPGERRKEALYGPAANAAMLATCFLMDGVPMIYNGQEIADAAPHSIFANRDHGGWCIDWSRANDAVAVERRALVKRLAKLRRDEPALFDAPVVWQRTVAPEAVFAFSRPLPSGRTLTLSVNISSNAVAGLPPHGFKIEDTLKTQPVKGHQ